MEAKEFNKNNNSYLWGVSHLQLGEVYEFKVRMRTVGTTYGEYTEGLQLKVGERLTSTGL